MEVNESEVASDQLQKVKSMRRRSGQKGQVVRKGAMWHIRFYVDVRGQQRRQRKSVPIGAAVGKEKLTKPEAARKGAEIIAEMGVNTAAHLGQAITPNPIVTFRQRVEWCRKYHQACTRWKAAPNRQHGKRARQTHSSSFWLISPRSDYRYSSAVVRSGVETSD